MKHLSPSRKRRAAWFLIGTMLAQLFAPYQAFALTGGPSQPEVQSFEPIGTSEMVDVSSGSFNYNIPLMEVGGYPINLAYHSGITPDDEASVCGLGWNINPGVVNRSMRGLPDDFSGDTIGKSFNLKPNETWGGKAGFKLEFFGLGKNKSANASLSLNMGVSYNNYRGVGLEFGIMPGFSAGQRGSETASFGLGITASSQSGITLSPSVDFRSKEKTATQNSERGSLGGHLSIGTPVNSREGLSVSASAKVSREKSSESALSKKAKEVAGQAKSIAKRLGLFNENSAFSFAVPSYSPSATMPFLNYSYSTSFSIGFEFTGVHPGGSFTGYYSKQELADKHLAPPAYGFLYAQNRKGNENALLDFNREKDGPFNKYTKHLPPVSFTNDVYGVTGQGIAGSYQLKRGDIGILSDEKVRTFGNGENTGGEVGFGAPPGVHGGGDLVLNNSVSWSGRWRNGAAGKLDFPGADTHHNNPSFEAAYFKIAGEKSVETDPAFIRDNGGTDPVRVQLDNPGIAVKNVGTTGYWETEGNVKYAMNHPTRKARERRNQSITYLTAEEAKNFGLEKKIKSHALNDFNFKNPTPLEIDRAGGGTPNFRKEHHLSEITALREDGLRYVYGIPAYNTEHHEVSFSVNNTGNCSDGLVSYTSSEASLGNTAGEDNYFNKVSTPPFAHSFLLTAVISQDYVDLTGNGPSPDDHGTYTKFNYTRAQTAYDWRIPYEAGMANFNEGFKSEMYDNKANYLTGKKEYWVLHSVESNTQVATFTYDTQNLRQDALSASRQVLPKLLRITLYALPDLRDNGLSGPNPATPIKTVWFDYDYSLCPGIPNNSVTGQGKLTLRKLWFTYGSSLKGKLSPYKFEYCKRRNGQIINPKYNLKAYNRWGSYQENKGAAGAGCYDHPELGALNTSDYPYIPQDNAQQADENATAYHLTNITLPSGGEIKVEYEANRYAYTQDRPAMEMMEVAGMGDDANDCPGSNALYSLPNMGNNYVFFKLRKPVANKDEFYEKYLRHAFGDKTIADGYLYFKFLLRVNSANTSPAKYEYVPGYAQISGSDYDVIQQGADTYGYIKLREAPVTDFQTPSNWPIQVTINSPLKTNPIAKTGWQFTRIYLPKVAYDNSYTPGSAPELKDVVIQLSSMVTQMGQLAIGFNNFMFAHRYSEQFVQGKSWMRLCSPERNKIAGGARVKSIRISDNWDKMDAATPQPFEYGQTYDYTTTTPSGDTISSGVAAYEPMIGGDENPFHQPQVHRESALLAPSNEFYQEEPFGESFFTSPQIVYNRVTVRNLPHSGVERTATGWVVHEFYTAKDFPTKTDDTGARKIPKKAPAVLRQLMFKTYDYMTATEGFAIELNDMHGKPKAQWVYDENGTRLSGVEYHYKRQGDRLVNQGIPVVMPDGTIQNATVGLEFSMAVDSREMYSKNSTMGIQLNTDNFMVGVYPVLTLIPLPSFHAEETRFRSMVATKVIQHYGLLEKTIAYDLGASVSTENVAWDAETGEVLLTRTENEFHDPVFNLNLPAHWGYEGMRGAYGNIGAEFTGVNVPTSATKPGIYAAGGLHLFFTPGDEFIKVGTNQKYWVKDVNRTNGEVYFITENGNPAIFSGHIKNIRSGRRNQQTGSIGSVAMQQNPFANAQNGLNFTGVEILNAGAMEYSDRWQTWCAPTSESACASFPGRFVNPYRTNNRGVFRPLRSWAYLTDRKQDVAGANIRFDGPFADFKPFWQLPTSGGVISRDPAPIWNAQSSGWTWTSQVTRYNPVGNELESRDTLNRYAAELTGYRHTQVVATAQNARYRQIAFDGFEDYFYDANAQQYPCFRRHFEFAPSPGQPLPVKKGTSHSGKYALELSGATASIVSGHLIKSPTPKDCPTPLAAKPANTEFRLDDCDCVGVFSPDPGQYVFSAWVREDRAASVLTFNQAAVKVAATVTGQTNPLLTTLKAAGPIIEGWQRISGEFSLPTGTTQIVITLSAAPGVTTWFDDLRIHPFDASFKSFVYDDVSLKFTYELDENNFFTKYEYDQQGMLERVKKETERGVMTIQESRFGQQKN